MKVEIKGALPTNVIARAIRKLKKITRVPRDSEFYFFESEHDGEELIRSLHRHARKSFRYVLLEEKNTFSYSHKGRKVIVVPLNKKKYLLKNTDALVGLLAHEVTHIKQQNQGKYKVVKGAFEQVFVKNAQLLNKLPYPKKKIQSLFNTVGATAILLLKDLFANSEIIAAGKGKYLLEYYSTEFRGRKICPRPVFYEKFREAAKKDLGVIAIAFQFEFSLLATLLPFEKYEGAKASRLASYISRCYELNVQEIARKCHELIYLYLDEFSYDQKFAKKFLNAIFNKVYLLLV